MKKVTVIVPCYNSVEHLDENMRQGGARNVALQYVEGEYLRFLDSPISIRASIPAARHLLIYDERFRRNKCFGTMWRGPMTSL
ncbi:MAG: glycosyltransferase [Eubacterium sp.]|nr:glycosyltransferase [Eubacterium sp.]